MSVSPTTTARDQILAMAAQLPADYPDPEKMLQLFKERARQEGPSTSAQSVAVSNTPVEHQKIQTIYQNIVAEMSRAHQDPSLYIGKDRVLFNSFEKNLHLVENTLTTAPSTVSTPPMAFDRVREMLTNSLPSTRDVILKQGGQYLFAGLMWAGSAILCAAGAVAMGVVTYGVAAIPLAACAVVFGVAAVGFFAPLIYLVRRNTQLKATVANAENHQAILTAWQNLPPKTQAIAFVHLGKEFRDRLCEGHTDLKSYAALVNVLQDPTISMADRKQIENDPTLRLPPQGTSFLTDFLNEELAATGLSQASVTVV